MKMVFFCDENGCVRVSRICNRTRSGDFSFVKVPQLTQQDGKTEKNSDKSFRFFVQSHCLAGILNIFATTACLQQVFSMGGNSTKRRLLPVGMNRREPKKTYA